MSKNDTAAPEFNLSEKAAAIAKAIRDQKLLTVTVGETSATITPEKDAYKKLLEAAGTTDGDLKTAQTALTDIFTALTHEVAYEGEQVSKKHKSIDSVTLDKFPIGKDKVRVTYRRQTEGQAGIGANATPVTHYGDVQAKYSSGVGSTSSASFGRLREHFRTQGAALFGPKK